MLIIGSTALRHHGLRWRPQRDLDIIGTWDEYQAYWVENSPGKGWRGHAISETKYVIFPRTSPPIEWEIALPGSSGEDLLKWLGADKETQYAEPGTVLALKLSHRYLKDSPAFLKTMNDIHELRELSYHPPLFAGPGSDWFKKREAETYTYKHPNLSQSKNTFFDPLSQVPYKWDHDDLHRAVALDPDGPAYSLYAEDGQEVKSSKAKWDRLSDRTKLDGVLEECYVLALERSLIPNDFKVPPRRAFLKALEKVCTSITSGWFREWAWEHYYQAVGAYDVSFVRKFHDALAAGRIKPYNTGE
jgi:hypothetical protein